MLRNEGLRAAALQDFLADRDELGLPLLPSDLHSELVPPLR